jgi:hypothetical protein
LTDLTLYNTLTQELRDDLRTWLLVQDYPENIVVYNDTAYGADENFYTQSPWYQYYSTEWHLDPNVQHFIKLIHEMSADDTSYIDVGCAAGLTGLTIAHLRPTQLVTFYDFPGIGQEFILDHSARYHLNTRFIPYGDAITRHTIALCFDVLEHTAMHTGTLEWLRYLGDNIAVTYPLRPFRPPFIKEADEYVDDEALQWIAEKRYRISMTQVANQRRFMLYQ